MMDRMPDVYLVEFLETQCLVSVFAGVLNEAKPHRPPVRVFVSLTVSALGLASLNYEHILDKIFQLQQTNLLLGFSN